MAQLITIKVHYACLNSCYLRSIDGRHILYGTTDPVKLGFNTCVRRTEIVSMNDSIYSFLGLSSVENVLNLCIDQMKKLVALWREIIAHGPGFGVGTKEEAAGGYLTERVDAEICDVLDTLMALEDVAEDMRIPYYTRYMVSTYLDEPCNCPDCQCETPQWLAPWLWKRAQKYHSDLPPAMFERVFAELRAEAAQNQTSLCDSSQRL